MKLWLMEILACPIDKHYPLKLEIFEWEPINHAVKQESDQPKVPEPESPNQTEEMSSDLIAHLIQNYNQGNLFREGVESPLESKINDEGVFVVKDALIIKYTPLINYLEELWNKTFELEKEGHWLVKDSSPWKGQRSLRIIVEKIRPIINEAVVHAKDLKSTRKGDLSSLNKDLESLFLELKHHLEFLNYLKYYLEIKTAVIRCSECGRWFPVVEAIPQMLPDSVRDEELDRAFEEKWLT